MAGPLKVLVSRRASSELWWDPDSGWIWTFDRPIGPLSDDDVRTKYGDEAFRRRDELATSGNRVYDPELSELIGRRVVHALESAGWSVDKDDTLTFRAHRDSDIIDVRIVGDSLSVDACGETLFSTSVGETGRILLRFSTAGAREVGE